MTNTLEKLTRIAKLIGCVLVAAVVVWRGNSYTDAHSFSALPQVMCAIFAVTLTFTGVALASGKN